VLPNLYRCQIFPFGILPGSEVDVHLNLIFMNIFDSLLCIISNKKQGGLEETREKNFCFWKRIKGSLGDHRLMEKNTEEMGKQENETQATEKPAANERSSEVRRKRNLRNYTRKV